MSTIHVPACFPTKGQRQDTCGSTCPVARAIRRLLLPDFFVHVNSVKIHVVRTGSARSVFDAPTPEAVRYWIHDHDLTNNPLPDLEFELDLPAEALRPLV